MEKYDHRAIEKKWQKHWEEHEVFRAEEKSHKESRFILDMFPYPSAQGLHVGHPEGYTASDIYSRYLRMKGFNVLHPMGFDAFGLPAENYAIKTGTHPADTTEKNIDNMRRQIQSLGFSYDWSREVITSDPQYYRWTQWIFVQLFKRGLAYEAYAPINWCPKDKTGLANEEVVDGKCERCGTQVTIKKVKQWLVKITDERYIERLLDGLDTVDWPENIIAQQKNWIGKSEGMQFRSPIKDTLLTVETFSAHFEAFCADTFVVIAPDHPLLSTIVRGVRQEKEVLAFADELVKKRMAAGRGAQPEPEGIFTGRYIADPVGNGELPIWVANYAVATYGTGIVKCSCHDERDFAFAKKYDIPLKPVLFPDDPVERKKVENLDVCFTDMKNGILTEPKEFAGKRAGDVHDGIIAYLEKNHLAKRKTTYKLRDWLFSRQRYWGEPIPVVHCERCKKNDKKTILIIHGTGSHGRKDWYGWLGDKLTALGHTVIAPNLPEADKPDLEKWLSTLETYGGQLDEHAIIIGHSLGGPAAMHLIARQKKKIGKLILIAPTHSSIDWDEYRNLHPEDPVEYQKKFHAQEVDYAGVQKKTGQIVYMYSDNDVYIPSSVTKQYKKALKGSFRLLPGRDHFTVSHGGAHTFPEVFTEILGEDPLPVGIFPVPEKELPVELPRVEKYEPTGTGESPLAAMDVWVDTTCPQCGGPAKRETNTMPQWAGSNWYFLRYCDPHNEKKLADPKKLAHWLPVDVYIGGAEHAVLHLLYARFIYKFLCDIEVIPKALVKEKGDEPFKKLKNQGLILGEDGQKMSKSRGNVVNPDEIIGQFGADTMRLYEMFMGPFEDPKPWSTRGIIGLRRFVDRVYSVLSEHINKRKELKHLPSRSIHKTIKKVTEDIESFKFNTAISAMMEFVNGRDWGMKLNKNGKLEGDSADMDAIEKFIKILSPFTPHLAEQLWQDLCSRSNDHFKKESSIFLEKWPEYDAKMIIEDTMTVVIQINGKIRDEIEMPVDTSEAEIKAATLAREKVQKWLAGKEPKKVIYVKGKLVSIVV